MATTERGIYYTTGADDAAVADLNVITKQIADSTEAALDALDGLKAARYYCTATQSGQTLAPNADCIVTYDGEIDPGSMLNTGTGVATIPAKGLYTVSGGLGYTADTVGDAFRRLRVLVSGSPIAEQSNVTHSGMLSVSWTGVLNASATVSLDCLHNNSGNLTGIGWMSVAFLGTVAS